MTNDYAESAAADALERLALSVDEACTTGEDPWSALQQLGTLRQGSEEVSELLSYAERALAYEFEELTGAWGEVTLGRRFSSATGDWPPAFDQVGDAEKRCWSGLAERVRSPLALAHFKDLTLQTGAAQGRERALEVIDLYLQLSRVESLDNYYRASCLRRAWTLARRFGLGDHEEAARHALFDFSGAATRVWNASPAVIFRALEPLAVAPRRGAFVDPSRAEVLDLLALVEAAHPADVTTLEAVFQAREAGALGDPDRELARRRLVSGYMQVAAVTEGLVKQHWLHTAAQAAQRFGLTDLRREAVSALQSIDLSELGLRSVSHEVLIPRYAFDARLGQYRKSRDTETALALWLTTPAPTGSYERNSASVARQGLGLLDLVSRSILDQYGLPVRTSTGPESGRSEALERLESATSASQAILLARELLAIGREYGPIAETHVVATLVSRFGSDHRLTASWLSALCSFWDGRPGDSARAAFPLIEAATRGLLLSLGDPLYRIETGAAGGRFPSLETYADHLEQHDFDQDWLRTIRGPISDLRNALAHGHLLDPSAEDAALLLRVAGLLVAISPPDSTTVDQNEVVARLRDPVKVAARSARLRRRWRLVWVSAKAAD